MSTRDAILKAADHIDRYPGQYDYCEAVNTPYKPTDRACMVGWIAYFAGEAGGQHCGVRTEIDPTVCDRLLGVGFRVFSDRMYEIRGLWSCPSNAKAAAAGLRIYADRFHPVDLRAAALAGTRAHALVDAYMRAA